MLSGGIKNLWRRGAAAATSSCSAGSARGYHGSGRYPCSPNEARRAGCRAMAPSLPSLSDPGQLWTGSLVPSRFPREKLRRCKGAASRGVLINSASTSLCSVRTGAAPAAAAVGLYSSYRHHSLNPSLSLHRSALQSEPTSSQWSQQMHKI